MTSVVASMNPSKSGVTGNWKEIRWLESYLAQGKMVAVVGVQSSQFQDITAGVPQGRVLGLTVFNCFMHDLPKVRSVDVC